MIYLFKGVSMLLVAIYLGFIGDLRFLWLLLVRLLKVVLLAESWR